MHDPATGTVPAGWRHGEQQQSMQHGRRGARAAAFEEEQEEVDPTRVGHQHVRGSNPAHAVSMICTLLHTLAVHNEQVKRMAGSTWDGTCRSMTMRAAMLLVRMMCVAARSSCQVQPAYSVAWRRLFHLPPIR